MDDPVEVGDELPELKRLVTREDVRAYAEVSGDLNPLHTDDAFARSVGFDGIIAHGMFTMAHMAACVVAWAGAAERVVSISAGFRAPVRLGDEIVAGGRVRSVDPVDGLAVLETWVSVERHGTIEWPVRKGEARVRL
jgi:acyl dehydratase